jgi:putative aminopeptidase FrvX
MPRLKAAAADLRRQARRADPLDTFVVPTACLEGGRLRPSGASRGAHSPARRASMLMALGCALCGAAHGGAPGHPAGRAGAALPTATAAPAGDPGRQLEAFLRVAAVAGREQPAAAFIREQLGRDLPVRSDALGDVTVTFGSGGPRRLVACALGEPGFVVSRIDGEGYLRLAAAGGAVPFGALWEQAHEGQLVWVAGARGAVPGAVAAPSVHLLHGRELAGRPFSITEAFVDVGAQSPAEAAELGIQVDDAVTLDRLPTRLAHGLVAGPSARVKAACLAEVEAARRFRTRPRTGTVVFAWTTGDLSRRAGLLHLLRRRGPFSELIVLGWELGWQRDRGGEQEVRLPAPGTGLLAGGALAGALPGLRDLPFEPRLSGGEELLDPASTGYLGLPALYPGTPVEAVAVADVRQLAIALVRLLSGERAAAPAAPASSTRGTSSDSQAPPAPPPLPASPPAAPPVASAAKAAPAAPAPPLLPRDGEARHAETAALLATLVAPSGVSGAEAPVRDAILHQLPPWAHPVVDWAGNLAVSFGGPAAAPAPDPGSCLFMAHMDEVGFQVSEVLADGRLKLRARGGLLRTLWEAHAALVQGRRGPVPAVVEPRPRWHGDLRRASADELTASIGAAGAAEVAALGIRVGSTVTMPKQMLRLGRHRVAAGSLDDRAGAAALLLALRRIHPAALRHRVTFAWTTREEAGFLGAAALARALPGPRRVYPVDVYASSDSPREPRQPAAATLGHGAVLGAAGGSYAGRAEADRVLALGRQRGIALQLAATVGPTDGIPFLAGGASVLPLSWAGRYSHAPAEVADLRDVEALVDLVVALAGE